MSQSQSRFRMRVAAAARVVTLLALPVFAAACGSGHAPGPDPSVADALWLPPNAQIQPDETRPLLIRSGRSVYADGSAAVRFVVEMDCDALVGAVLTQAAVSEWHRRSSPVDNPEQVLPTGNTCVPGPGGTGWAGEWNDHQGGVVRYAFSAQGAQVRGEAVFHPRDLVVRKKTR